MAASRTWAGKKMILDHLEMSEGMEMLRWKKKNIHLDGGMAKGHRSQLEEPNGQCWNNLSNNME